MTSLSPAERLQPGQGPSQSTQAFSASQVLPVPCTYIAVSQITLNKIKHFRVNVLAMKAK